MHMLRERGYNTRDTIIENELVIDNRPLGSLSPVKSKLEYSQGFIAHRQQFAQQKASRSDYLRMSPSELALAKARVKQPKVVITPKEQLHQRLVVLISDDHFDRTVRASAGLAHDERSRHLPTFYQRDSGRDAVPRRGSDRAFLQGKDYSVRLYWGASNKVDALGTCRLRSWSRVRRSRWYPRLQGPYDTRSQLFVVHLVV